jgi:hypothetical protein
MHPLHYVKPVNFEFDEPQYTGEIGLNSNSYIEDKENLNTQAETEVSNSKVQ